MKNLAANGLMMNDCKGLFGKWFGHDFESFLIKGAVDFCIGSDNKILIDSEIVLNLDTAAKYEIRCKRCGCKADE